MREKDLGSRLSAVTLLRGCEVNSTPSVDFHHLCYVTDEICISARDSKVIPLQCEILNTPQPNPTRSWFKNDELIYSVSSGVSVSLTDYYMNYPILNLGVLEPPVLTATSDGTIYFNYEVKNITNPDELTPNTTIEQAQQIVLEHLIGSWTCNVSNTFGSAISITYVIIDQCSKQCLLGHIVLQ